MELVARVKLLAESNYGLRLMDILEGNNSKTVESLVDDAAAMELKTLEAQMKRVRESEGKVRARIQKIVEGRGKIRKWIGEQVLLERE